MCGVLCHGPLRSTAMFLSIALTAIIGFLWILWRCPRCKGLFFVDVIVAHPFTPRCLHCGLPKWSTDPDA